MSKKKATDVKADKTNEDKPVNVTEETTKSEKVETVSTDAVDKNVPTEDVSKEQVESNTEKELVTKSDVNDGLEDKAKELSDDVDTLNSYVMDNPEFNKLGRLEKALMFGQLKAMQTYLHMLNQRIKLHNEK